MERNIPTFRLLFPAFADVTKFPNAYIEAQWTAERRGLSRFRTEQPPYSIFVRHIELDVLPVARSYGMGVLIWSPLCRGWLTGRYRRGSFDRSPESRRESILVLLGRIAAQDGSAAVDSLLLDAIRYFRPAA